MTKHQGFTELQCILELLHYFYYGFFIQNVAGKFE